MLTPRWTPCVLFWRSSDETSVEIERPDPKEILHILDVADEYKRLHKQGVDPKDLQGKAVALIFAKNPPAPAPV